MQNIVEQTISSGYNTVNNGMSVASKLADSVDRSISQVSKIGFGLQRILKDAEADKFMKEVTLEKMLLDKQKEKFYEMNINSNINYRNKALENQQHNIEANDEYRNKMLEFNNDKFQKNYELSKQKLEAYKQKLAKSGGVGGSNTNQLSITAPTGVPINPAGAEATQANTVDTNFKNPYVQNIYKAYASVINGGVNPETLQAERMKLQGLLAGLKANAGNPKVASVLNKKISAQTKIVKMLESQSGDIGKYIDKTVNNILNNQDDGGYGVLDDNKKQQILAIMSDPRIKDKKTKFLNVLSYLDNERVAAQKPISISNTPAIVKASIHKLNDKNTPMQTKIKLAKTAVNAIRSDPLDSTNEMINTVKRSGLIDTDAERLFSNIKKVKEDKPWENKDYNEVTGGMWQAVNGGDEDNVNKPKLTRYLINNSLKELGFDAVTPLLKELKIRKGSFIDSFGPITNNNYGYDINIGTDKVDYGAITKATVDLLHKYGIRDKYIEKQMRLKGGFNHIAFGAGENFGKSILDYIQKKPKLKNLVETYVKRDIARNGVVSDLDKTLIFGYIIHPAMIKYKQQGIHDRDRENVFLDSPQ